MKPLFSAADAQACAAYFAQRLAQLSPQLAVLPDKTEETAEATLIVLWCLAQGVHTSIGAAEKQILSPLIPEQIHALDQFIDLRLSGVPLAHISGRQQFMGLELLATPAALIPRAETEILVRLALDCLAPLNHQSLTVMDVCTGSGNVALSLAFYLPQARVLAADLSVEAVALAQRNAECVQLQDRVEFQAGDLCAPFSGAEYLAAFDLISCNPPYIMASNVKKMPKEIADYEPELAFNGGPMGIGIIERMIQEAHSLLKPGGFLCLEVGAGQGAFIEKRLHKSGLYQSVVTACDAHGVVRALAARK